MYKKYKKQICNNNNNNNKNYLLYSKFWNDLRFILLLIFSSGGRLLSSGGRLFTELFGFFSFFYIQNTSLCVFHI